MEWVEKRRGVIQRRMEAKNSITRASQSTSSFAENASWNVKHRLDCSIHNKYKHSRLVFLEQLYNPQRFHRHPQHLQRRRIIVRRCSVHKPLSVLQQTRQEPLSIHILQLSTLRLVLPNKTGIVNDGNNIEDGIGSGINRDELNGRRTT